MPLVLDTAQTVEVDVTHIVIKQFEIDPDKEIAKAVYQKGSLDSNESFVPAASNTIMISGSNFNSVIVKSEGINADQGLSVYESVKKALYEYIASYEEVSGSVK